MTDRFAAIIQELMGPQAKSLADFVVRGDDAQINRLVDQINVLKLPTGKKFEDLEVAPPAFELTAFKKTLEFNHWRQIAEERLLSGAYIPQFIFAGAASRLLKDLEDQLKRKLDAKKFRMYGLNLWETAKLAGISAPDPKTGGIGLLQIQAQLELIKQLAKKHSLPEQKVLANQHFIFHINDDIYDQIVTDFKQNNFFGLDRSQIYFVIQPLFKGYRLSANGTVEYAPESAPMPYGHGYATQQLLQRDAFTFDARFNRVPMEIPVLEKLAAEDSKREFILASHRVNDMTKFRAQSVVDLDLLALSLKLLADGFGVTIELVGNPQKQKGGNNIRFKGELRSFLIETSNAKGSAYLTQILGQAAQKSAPYNTFRLTSTPAIYRQLLQKQIPYNLRYKEGFFYLELVTGDLTQHVESNAVAIQKAGEVIHDFKQLSNLAEALEFAGI